MSILQELSRILDLPEEMVIGEAQTKLGETLMFVNGEMSYVSSIEKQSLIYFTSPRKQKELEAGKVTSLEVWLPESGIYQHPKIGPVYILKTPYRQWKKSFNSGLYKVYTIQGKVLTDFAWNFMEIDPKSRVDFYKNKDGIIYYHRKNIGHFESDNSVVCTFPAIEYELRKWLSNLQQ